MLQLEWSNSLRSSSGGNARYKVRQALCQVRGTPYPPCSLARKGIQHHNKPKEPHGCTIIHSMKIVRSTYIPFRVLPRKMRKHLKDSPYTGYNWLWWILWI